MKYKVGDDVVVVSDKSDCFYKLGDVGVVEDVDEVENLVEVLFNGSGKSWWVSESELELVEFIKGKYFKCIGSTFSLVNVVDIGDIIVAKGISFENGKTRITCRKIENLENFTIPFKLLYRTDCFVEVVALNNTPKKTESDNEQYNPLDVQEGGVKFDLDKEEYSLLPKGVLKPIMRVLGFGAKKYAKDNWQKVSNAKERYFNALHRHLDAWWVSESELELTQAAEPKTIHDKLLQGISKISIGDQPAMIIPSNTPMKVKSSGGSSSYYFSKLPKEVIDEIVEKGGIELKDVVKYCFYNDADVKDITKAIKRIMEDLRGGGKEGIDAQYDLNKIKFFFNEFEKSVLIQKREQELSYDR